MSAGPKKPNKTLLLERDKCISCAGCVGTCPDLALDMFGVDLQVFQDKCTYCTICVRFCPVGALSIVKGSVAAPGAAASAAASAPSA
jgi:ferredoxin